MSENKKATFLIRLNIFDLWPQDKVALVGLTSEASRKARWCCAPGEVERFAILLCCKI